MPLFVVLVSFMFWPTAAWAYIDPGTGAMVVQLLIAGFIACVATIKLWWNTARAFFCKIMAKKPKADV